MGDYRTSFKLLCPGPVNVHPEIARALTAYEICHREEEFEALLAATRRNALAVAGADAAVYSALVVTGSGTAGNEAVLASAVAPDQTVVVLSNGEFGTRLAQISSVYNDTVHLEHAWGEPLDLHRLSEVLHERGDIGLVAVVHHETSTGVLNPVEAIGELCALHGVRLFVDMVSSYSADPVDLSSGAITFMTTSSGKAIAAYPGLALVIARRDALEALGDLPVKNHYLSLYRHHRFAEDHEQTPNTPAVPLVMALNRALELALEEGVEARRKRLAGLAAYVRAAVRERGLSLYVEDQPLSSVLTSVRLPEGVAFEPLRRALREWGFVIYGGKGPLTGQIVQISTISDLDTDVIDAFFAALDEVMPHLRVVRGGQLRG
ncbi:MAG: alanine--glyoxylate aminotransferase family protein [Deltaproteobacteria bacterium]|nr:alanine--glyoxylate aminotransferase family protein [Deltaproteobacteria bacterium]